MGSSKMAVGLALVLCLLAGTSGYALRWKRATPTELPVKFEQLPMRLSDFGGTEERFSPETYEVLGADTTMLRRYVGPSGEVVWLFVAYYGSQNFGEQIHSPRNCLPGGGWTIETSEQVPLSFPDRGEVTANRLFIESGGSQQVMYYFFVTRLGSVASEYKLKLDLARAALAFEPRDALFVRVSSSVTEAGPDAADASCRQLLAEGMPMLSRGLPF